MPELPEVEGLARFLRAEAVGSVVATVTMASIAALKTVDPPVTALAGLSVTGAARHGKFIDLDVDGLHLVFHLGKAGWLRWYDSIPATPLRPGKGPIAMRVRLDSIEGGEPYGFDLTEAGTKRRLAVYVVRNPRDIPAIAALGPDPLAMALPEFDGLVRSSHAQIKGVLRDQNLIAGVGNAYSDEILHAAKLSPFAMADTLDADAVRNLFDRMHEILAGAVAAADGKPAKALKDAKRSGMRVHGRAGEPCPVCGDTVREVSFADSALQYCPTCQTRGKILADRRTSKFL
ncbi:Fpg/Nei family DNA glycosylase, partial [Spelaeicoccus albus]